MDESPGQLLKRGEEKEGNFEFPQHFKRRYEHYMNYILNYSSVTILNLAQTHFMEITSTLNYS